MNRVGGAESTLTILYFVYCPFNLEHKARAGIVVVDCGFRVRGPAHQQDVHVFVLEDDVPSIS